MRKRGFTIEEADRVATELGIQWTDVLFDTEQFRKGMDVELEHGKVHPETNVTNDDPVATGKIAWAHLMERPDYYELLELVESGAIQTERGPDMTVKELADATEGYARTVSFAFSKQKQNEGRTMPEHPTFIKVAGELYQLEDTPQAEETPRVIKVKGYEYERVDELAETPAFIRVKGMLFKRDDELTLREAAKKGKGKGKKDDKKSESKGKGKDEKGSAKGKSSKKSPSEKSKGKWEKLPKGWTNKSAESFWNSIGGSVTECRRKLKDAPEIDNTGAFCSSLKDRMEGEGWRKQPRKKKSKKASAEAPRFVTYQGIRYELED